MLVLDPEPEGPRTETCSWSTSDLCLQRNTFQLVVVLMPSSSCAILLYPRDGLQFLSTSVGGEDKLLEAGFNEGLVPGWFWNTKQGAYFKTTSEDEASIQQLTEYETVV